VLAGAQRVVVVVRVLWHLLRREYYSAALRHLSAFEPTHPDLCTIIIEHNRSTEVVRDFINRRT